MEQRKFGTASRPDVHACSTTSDTHCAFVTPCRSDETTTHPATIPARLRLPSCSPPSRPSLRRPGRGPVLTAAARDGDHVLQAGTRRCLGRTRRWDGRKYQEARGRLPILGGLTRPRIVPLWQPASAHGQRQIKTRARVRSPRGWRVRGSLCSGNRPANQGKQPATRDRLRVVAEQGCARSGERAGKNTSPSFCISPKIRNKSEGSYFGLS